MKFVEDDDDDDDDDDSLPLTYSTDRRKLFCWRLMHFSVANTVTTISVAYTMGSAAAPVCLT